MADDYSEELPVSRGQWQAIAEDCVKLLGAEIPSSRFDATVLLVRLRKAREFTSVALPEVSDGAF